MNANAVITAQEVKDWVRIDGNADDATINLLIATAQEQAEAYTGQTFNPLDCPYGVKTAIAVYVADLYRNREGKTVGEACFYRILNPFRVSIL